MAINLPLPQVPEIPQKGGRKTAVAAASPSPAARQPAGKQAPDKAAKGAPPPAAGAKSAPAPAGSSPAAAAPEGSSRVREIFARTGDELEIGLEGEGFMFLGFPGGTPFDGMIFKAKEVRDRKSYFKFKASRLGVYELAFLQQDNTSGRSVRETVRVRVVSDADFTAAVERAAPAEPPTALDPGDPEYAEKLASLGKYDAALIEYLKGYREGDGKLNDRIASLYLLSGSLDAAEKYYRKNLIPAGPYSESAIVGLVGIAVQRGDSGAFLSLLKPFLAIRDLNIEEQLLRASRFLKERGEIGLGLELVEQCGQRYPDGALRDEALFLQASLLEEQSPRRDIQKARDLYREVLQRFPESPFAAPARDRVRYIEQHFYLIR